MISASPSSSTKFVLVGNIWMSPVETDYRWWLNLSVGQDSWQFHAHFYTEENKLTATQSLSLHLSVLVLMLQKLWESHNQNTFIHRLLLPVTIYYYSFYRHTWHRGVIKWTKQITSQGHVCIFFQLGLHVYFGSVQALNSRCDFPMGLNWVTSNVSTGNWRVRRFSVIPLAHLGACVFVFRYVFLVGVIPSQAR